VTGWHHPAAESWPS